MIWCQFSLNQHQWDVEKYNIMASKYSGIEMVNGNNIEEAASRSVTGG